MFKDFNKILRESTRNGHYFHYNREISTDTLAIVGRDISTDTLATVGSLVPIP